jgi:regulatory protein
MNTERTKKKLTLAEAKFKAEHFCAYQERCHQEVEAKLKEWLIFGDWAAEVILHLIEHKFLNEERFAKAYAGGKFRTQHWGRLKIKNELKKRAISPFCIQLGMKEIEEDDYQKVLETSILKKRKETKAKTEWERNNKVATYLIGRGFEPELVWSTIKSSSQETD